MSLIYRMTFNNVEEVECQLDIVDLSTPDDDGTIITIDGAEDAVRTTTVDNDELKYGIKPTKCVIKFLNSQSVNLDTFSTGEDGRFKVFYRVNTKNVFSGWLEQGDIEEPFLYQQNQVVTLTAIDGLAYLKDARYVDFDGVTIVNKFRELISPINHIARCLARTGLQLNINVIDNRREENNPGKTWWESCFVLPETFEDSINTGIPSWDVAEELLSVDCILKQAKGGWWIERTTELRQDFPLYVTVYDTTGNYLSGPTEITLEKAIGLKPVDGTPFAESPDAEAFFSKEATRKKKERPYKATKLNYPFNYPLEILCNQNLIRGTLIGDLPDETDEDGNTLTVKNYDTECWIYLKYTSTDPPAPVTQDSNAYIKVRYREGHEIERYIHFEETADWPAQYRLKNAMEVETGVSDRFTVSFSFKWSSDLGGSKPYVVRMAEVRLIGEDGTFWSVQGGNQGSSDIGPYWRETDSDFKDLAPIGVVGYPSLVYSVNEGTDLTKWINATWDIPSAPRSGLLQFILLRESEDSTATSRDVSPIDFTYHPYIGGGYDIFNAQSYTATQSGDYRRTLEQEVSISNAPRKLIKGALLVTNTGPGGDLFMLAGRFYEGQQFPADDPTEDDLFEFGYLQDISLHNQLRNTVQKYDATCQGLGEGAEDSNGDADQFDLLHRIYNRDLEPGTNNVVLELTNLDIDWRNAEWKGTLIENFNLITGFVFDPVEFKYETGQ